MQTRQGNVLQALRGVQEFLDEHAAKLGVIVNSGARKKLDAQVEALNLHVLTQSQSDLTSQGATQKQNALRHTVLHDHMAPIARIARAELPDTPEVEPLRMPQERLSTERLYATAIGMAKAAELHVDVFVSAGLAEDFVERLRAAADLMRSKIDLRTKSRGIRRGATQGVDELIRAALNTVRILDAFVRSALRNDPALLANWTLVRRPPTKPGKPAGSGSEPTPPAPSSPAAPPPPPLKPAA